MIELKYAIDFDKHGLVDGRNLARHLIAYAYQLLVPYTGACAGCTDDLFSVLANEVIEIAHKEARQSGTRLKGSFVMMDPDAPDNDASIRTHLDEAKERTRQLLASAATPHEHT